MTDADPRQVRKGRADTDYATAGVGTFYQNRIVEAAAEFAQRHVDKVICAVSAGCFVYIPNGQQDDGQHGPVVRERVAPKITIDFTQILNCFVAVFNIRKGLIDPGGGVFRHNCF
ncbi:hypothetical protein DSECCO2_602420 [anaerobic digester metagenome]